MSKKGLIIIALIIAATVAGLMVWRVEDSRAKVAKIEAEIVKGFTAEEIALILKSQALTDGATIEFITQTPETRKAFLKGMREHLALAAVARREGLADDPDFKINLEYKKNILLADLYKVKSGKVQGKYNGVTEEEVKAVWTNLQNEKQFNTDMETLQMIQKETFEVRGDTFVPSRLQGESLTKARINWARTKVLSDKAKADTEFLQKPEVGLRFKVLEAGILSTDYLRKHWTSRIRPTQQEIVSYLSAHPEFDKKKKLEKAETVLQRVKSGDDFAALAKEFSEHRPTKNNGGLFENLSSGQVWAELETSALTLEKGQIADKLVETEIGYHIVKLEDKQIKKDKDGKEIITYSVRHILFQKKFEQPGIANPDIPPPFMTAEEIAKLEVEKEKRNRLVEEIVQRNQIVLPDDFTVELQELKKTDSTD